MWCHGILISQSVKSLPALSLMKPNKKGVRWAQDKRKRSHAHSKNAVWFAFYCVQMTVHKRAEPARVGGLADWLRTDLTDSRSPPPLILTVTAVYNRQAGVVLSRNAWGWEWLCLGVKVSLIIVIITLLILLLFISLFQLLLFKTLVIFQGLSSEIKHCSGNYSLAEEMTNLEVCA